MNHQPRILVRSIATLLALAALQQANAADRVWNGATGGTWHTVTNWLPNTGFPGEATAAVTGEGLPTDIAQFTGTNISANVGINMGTMGGTLSLGAIEVARTAAGSLTIGNNSATNGVLQLNGATVNGVANTLIRVANTAAADLTIANVNTGTGTQTMGLRLGNANGFFTVETGRTLVISSIISQLVANTGYTKNGPGTMSISGANTYTGPVLVSDGVLRISNATALGAATATPTVTVTNADGTAVNDNELQITGGITVNRNLVLENTANANARTHLRSTNTINANNNTWSGSVTFKGGSNQALNAASSPLTLTGAILNDGTTPSTQIFFRGANTGTIAAAATVNLGSASLFKTDGGTWNFNNTTSAISGTTTIADGTLTVGANNALSTTAPIVLGQGTGTSGTLNLANGISQTIASLTVASGSTGTQRVTGSGALDTGVLNRTFTVNDSAGIPQDLIINAPIIGSGGFTKTGAGTLAVNNSVDGPVTLSIGRIEGAGTFNGGLAVDSGTTLSPGTDTTAGTITTSNLNFLGGANTVNLNVGTAGEFLNNTGGIAGTGVTTITLTAAGSLPNSGAVDLITHDGSYAGTAGFTLPVLPGRVTGGLINTGSSIALNIISNSKVIWTGAGAPGTTWDVGTTQNWKLQTGGTPTEFIQGDDLIFDDTGLNTTSIDLSAAANPARAEFQNTAGSGIAYTIAGSGGMGASMILDKTGDGQVTLAPVNASLAANASAHTYVGTTNIDAGILTLDYTGLTGTNAATARVINPVSAVNIATAGTLQIRRNNVATVFANNLTGDGLLRVDITNGGTAGSQNFAFSGNNSGFFGTIHLAPTGGGTTGTFRTTNAALSGGAPVAAFGAALIDVDAGAQMWGAAGTYSNNLNISGAGFAEGGGGAVPDADLQALGYANYAGSGAIRLETGTNLTGSVTLQGPAKIQVINNAGGTNAGTATISGNITNTAPGDVLVVGGASTNATHTLILTGDNSGLEQIWVNSAGSGGTGAFDILQIGANGFSGTLGAGNVTLHADAARGAGIRFSRADGYTLAAGQNILADVAAAADHARLRLFVNATGSGFTINGNTIDLSDGINGGTIAVAGNDNTNGVTGATFNIDGAASLVETGNFFLGDAVNMSGTVNQTDGTVNVSGHMRIAHWSTNTSNYNINGGSLNFVGAAPVATPSGTTEVATGGIYLGIDGTGNLTQSGGIVNTHFVVLDNRTATVAGANMPTGIDTYTLTGGSLNLKSQWGVIARNPTSTQFVLNGGTIANTAAAGIAVALDTPITVGASGGTIDTSADGTNSVVLMRDVSGAGNAITLAGSGKLVFNPNGKATLDGTSDGLGTQLISADLSGGTMTVEKVGAGTTTLAGTNSYAGPTTVTAGTLAVTGSLANSAVTINAGGNFAPSVNIGGSITLNAGGALSVGGNTAGAIATTISTPTLTIGGGTVNIDFTGTAADRVNVSATNGLTINAATASVFAGLNGWVTGSYPVFTYAGAVQGAGASALTASPAGHSTINFTDDLAGTVSMNITAVTNKWVGGTVGAETVWDINNTNNWNASDTKYLEGDNVLFDDTASNFTPSLAVNVAPANVTFANSASNFTLGGSAGIAGATNVVINGGTPSSTVTLAPANSSLAANASLHTYTGATAVNSGTLVLDYTGLTGTNAVTARVVNSASAVSVAAGATLKLLRGDNAFTFSNPISGAGTVELNAHALAGGTTPHTITLNGTNTGFTGTLRLAAPVTGTYRLGTPTQAALGSAAIDVKSGAQLQLATGTYTNNITIAGNGFADSAGNIGALRIDNVTYAGNVVIDGSARIGAHNGTGTITGNISGGDLSVNATNFNNNYTLVFTGSNSYGTTTIGGQNTQTAGVPSMRLNIGNGGTTGTLGTGNVTIHGDGANGVLGFDRADGYTLAQTITSAGSQLGRTFVDIDTLGTGFDSAGFAINLGTPAAGGHLRVGVARADAVGTISGTLTGGTIRVGAGANMTGATLNLNGANVSVSQIDVALAATNATLNISGGSTVAMTGGFFLGQQNGFTGVVHQFDGTVTVGNRLQIGHWPNNTSTYTLDAGSVTIANTNTPTNPSTTGATEQTGGVYLGVDGTGVMNQSGGTLTTDWVVLDNRGDTGGTDQYNLSGGVLETRMTYGIIRRNTSAEFNFSGGTIRNVGVGISANIDAPMNLSGTTPTIDTNGATNAYNVLQGMIGDGDLTKVGAGTLSLNAASPFWSGDLYAEGGTTAARAALGDGTSTVNVDSTPALDGDDPVTMVFTTSQTLAALNIGPNGTVILDSTFPSPAPFAGEGDPLDAGLSAQGGDLAVAAVPEPSSLGLLAVGVLGLLHRRRKA